MSNYKLELKLKQYTPLLHFQGDEAGACLRASEVKPKLDRYIYDMVGFENLPESWFDDKTKGQKRASLRYRMTFTGAGTKLNRIHPLYFGAMGNNREHTVRAMDYSSGITMTVFGTAPGEAEYNGQKLGLIALIGQLAGPFFELHCFGTRSNKGFGSFSVEGFRWDPDSILEYLPGDCEGILVAENDMDANQNDANKRYNANKRLDDVYILSALLKGGINRPSYAKGRVHKYAADHDYGHEKAYIKSNFTPEDREYYEGLCKPENQGRTGGSYENGYRFVRAMLGLTDKYTFGIGRDSKRYPVKDASEQVKRFANPIVFKPYENGVLILLYRIPEAMYGREFCISGLNLPDARLNTPTKEEFNLCDFVFDALAPLNENADKGSFPGDWYDLAKPSCRIRLSGYDIVPGDTLNHLSVIKTERRNA